MARCMKAPPLRHILCPTKMSLDEEHCIFFDCPFSCCTKEAKYLLAKTWEIIQFCQYFAAAAVAHNLLLMEGQRPIKSTISMMGINCFTAMMHKGSEIKVMGIFIVCAVHFSPRWGNIWRACSLGHLLLVPKPSNLRSRNFLSLDRARALWSYYFQCDAQPKTLFSLYPKFRPGRLRNSLQKPKNSRHFYDKNAFVENMQQLALFCQFLTHCTVHCPYSWVKEISAFTWRQLQSTGN